MDNKAPYNDIRVPIILSMELILYNGSIGAKPHLQQAHETETTATKSP